VSVTGRALGCALTGLACAAWVTLAQAQSNPPRMRATAQPSEVGVGEPFIIELIALVPQNERPPTNPKLNFLPGLMLKGGPQIGSRTEATLGGRPVVLTGIDVKWQVEAMRQGTFKIGPPSVEWNGRRYETNPVEVKVGPKGSKPKASPDPMDPFGLFPQLPFPKLPGFDDLLNPPAPPEPPSDPALALNAAPDAMLFLRAISDKQQAVIGEQVTLSIYQYTRSGSPEPVDVHEPTAPDFFQRALSQPGTDQDTRVAYVGGNPWRAELLRKIALFPLRTGRLEIGPMRASFAGFGMSRRASAIVSRQSNPLLIQALDAPLQGRPPGFRAGDVGRFSLAANVDPRTAEANGAVGVTVTVSGTGNLPLSLPVPARSGIEWLEPEVREKIDVQNDRIAGSRTFRYVVRLANPGQNDLGELTLPYYDPDAKAYAIARTALGRVAVTPSTSPAPSAAPQRDPFEALAGPRRMLGAAPAASKPLTDQPAYWLILAGSPLTVLMFGAGAWLTNKVGLRVKQSRSSLSRRLSDAVRDARAAARTADTRAAASAVERAIHASIEGATGLRSRGMLRQELLQGLTDQGIEAAVAERVAELLERCDRVRFEPEAGDTALRELVDQGVELASSLARQRGRAKA
jgi:hypothetical protein